MNAAEVFTDAIFAFIKGSEAALISYSLDAAGEISTLRFGRNREYQ